MVRTFPHISTPIPGNNCSSYLPSLSFSPFVFHFTSSPLHFTRVRIQVEHMNNTKQPTLPTPSTMSSELSTSKTTQDQRSQTPQEQLQSQRDVSSSHSIASDNEDTTTYSYDHCNRILQQTTNIVCETAALSLKAILADILEHKIQSEDGIKTISKELDFRCHLMAMDLKILSSEFFAHKLRGEDELAGEKGKEFVRALGQIWKIEDLNELTMGMAPTNLRVVSILKAFRGL